MSQRERTYRVSPLLAEDRPSPKARDVKRPFSAGWFKNYANAKVQGVLSPYDGISRGILSALKSAGYGSASQPYPVVTGQELA